MSPLASSWRPQTAVGTEWVASSSRLARSASAITRTRAVDCRGRIADRPAPPAPDLVAEDPEATEQP